jgi:predicted phosphate transport protein (TIGR00153 family)
MFQFIKSMMPREEKFFDLFEAQAAKAQEAAQSLRSILDGGKGLADNCARLSRQEEEADHISYEVMQAIRRAFITPFDRSDIKGLSSSLDDAIDQMNKTGKVVMLYDVKEFEPNMRAMADRTILMAKLVAEALPLLRNIGQNGSKLHALAGELTKIEEQSDQLNDEGLRALYKGRAKKDPLAFVIGAELYEHLEKVCDRFEDVAHVMSDIVIEHA